MRTLHGHVALVTGASKGIGASMATPLAAEGAAVVVTDATSTEGAERVGADLLRGGGQALAVQAEVATPAAVRHLWTETTRVVGRLESLVQGLARVIEPSGRLFLMCGSAEEPHDIIPRVSRQELYDAFADGWEVESVQPVRYELNPEYAFTDVTFSEGGAKGWFAIVRRKE